MNKKNYSLAPKQLLGVKLFTNLVGSGLFVIVCTDASFRRALLESKHNRTALIVYAKPKKDKADKANNNNNNTKTKKKADGGAAGGVRGSVAAPVAFVSHHNAYVQGDTTLAEDNFSDYIEKVIANEHIEPEDQYIL